MTVEHRVGDLFAQADLRALGHGVNCVGVMGAGIARPFRDRWPDMYAAYRQECLSRRLRLGGLFAWTAPDGLVVYNLATQHQPGRHARLEAVESSLAAAVAHAEIHGVPAFGLPRIGAGIGGLSWPQVSAVVDRVAGGSPVRVVVITQGPAGSHQGRPGEQECLF